MSQKSSLPQEARAVPQVLTPDSGLLAARASFPWRMQPVTEVIKLRNISKRLAGEIFSPDISKGYGAAQNLVRSMDHVGKE
jgi:hypothetical protein